SNAARNSAYDSTTHCTSIAVALRFACRAGRATFTTVPSMNDMLEPRMVAARIQRPCALPHDDADLFADITPSSHGGLRRFIWLTRLCSINYRLSDRGTSRICQSHRIRSKGPCSLALQSCNVVFGNYCENFSGKTNDLRASSELSF